MKKDIASVTSLRLVEEKDHYIRKKASEIGISQHAFTVMLIDLGIRVYESEVRFNVREGE